MTKLLRKIFTYPVALQAQQATSIRNISPLLHATRLAPSSRSNITRPLSTTMPIYAKTVSVTFIDRDGDKSTVAAKIGDTLLEVAKEFDIDVEGACEGTLSCSTCHLIVDPAWFDKIPDLLTEEEQDMLDLAYSPTDTSRLGCQIMVTKDLDGLLVTVPSATQDIRNT